MSAASRGRPRRPPARVKAADEGGLPPRRDLVLESRLLELHADPLADRGPAASPVESEHLDRPGVGRPQALEHLDRRRLAGPVRAEHRDARVATDLEIEAVHGGQRAEPLDETARAEGRGTGHARDAAFPVAGVLPRARNILRPRGSNPAVPSSMELRGPTSRPGSRILSARLEMAPANRASKGTMRAGETPPSDPWTVNASRRFASHRSGPLALV